MRATREEAQAAVEDWTNKYGPPRRGTWAFLVASLLEELDEAVADLREEWPE